jgi:hypothetical protein
MDYAKCLAQITYTAQEIFMKQKSRSFFSSNKAIILTGLIIGVIGSSLQKLGNPKNMTELES